MADRSLTLVFLGKDVSAGMTAEALAAKVAALQHAMDDNAKSSENFDKKLQGVNNTLDKANGRFRPMLDTALLLGPALVPIGAAAVGAAAGLAGLGATGVLAFLGIKREIKDGTELGQRYQAALAPVVDEFHQLEHIAAVGVFGGISRGITTATKLFPEINTQVASLSVHMGNIAGNLGAAFVNIFRQAEPLFAKLASQVDRGSVALLHWSQSSDGVGKFAALALRQLPVAEHILKDIAIAIGHIVEASAPIGSVTLRVIDNLSTAIAKIPTPVLTALLVSMQALRLVWIGGGLAQIVGFFTGVGLTAAGAAVGVGALVAATALFASTVQKHLPQFGVNLQQLTGQLKSLNSNYGKQVEAFGSTVEQAFEQGGAGAQKLALQAALATTSLGPVNTALVLTGQSTASFAQALTGTDSGWKLFLQNAQDGYRAAGASKNAINDFSGDLQKLRDQFLSGKITGEQMATALKQLGITATTTATPIEILTQKFNNLTDAQLGASDASLGFKLANLQLQQALKDTHGDLRLTTQAGLQNNLTINQAIRLAEQDGEQLSKLEFKTKSKTAATKDGTAKTIADLVALRNSITAYGGNADAVQALINKLTGYNNKPVAAKKPVVDTRAAQGHLADLNYDIDHLHDHTSTVKLVYDTSAVGGGGAAIGGRAVLATGGYLQGPGTKTSDSIPLWGSTGEFMMQAAAVDKYGRGFMENLNAMKFAGGGLINLILPPGPTIQGRLNTIESGLHPTKSVASVFGGGTPGAFSGSQLDWVFAAEAATGTSTSWTAAILRRIMFESGGNPNAINNWDSNAMAGDPSRGLMQTIMSTFMAYHQPGTSNNIYDPVANIAAAINYIKSRYGSIFAIDPPVQGYGSGGTVGRTGLGWLHQGEEVLANGPAQAVRAARASASSGGGDTYVINVNVAGNVTSERNLVTAVRAGIRDQLRSEGKTATVI